MSEENDFHCSKAPAQAPTLGEPTDKVDVIEAKSGSGKGWYALIAFLLACLAAGIIYYLSKDGGAAASTSVEAATASEGSSENVAPATVTDAPPPECVGEIVDPNLQYYCQYILPFAKKAVADHGRIGRLEAEVKELKERGPEAPLALWAVMAFIGLLAAYSAVKSHSKKDERPPR